MIGAIGEAVFAVAGGACFIDHGRYNVMAPFVALVVSTDGVRFEIRPGWAQAFIVDGFSNSRKRFASSQPWTGRWSEIVGARFAGETVVLEHMTGDRCRFVGPSPQALQPVRVTLDEHEVRTATVKSTYFDIYLNRRWPRT